MVKYRVLRDCHWNYGYWEKDRVVEFPEGKNSNGEVFPIPNEHFQRLGEDGKDAVEVVPEKDTTPRTFSELNKANDDIPNTGMMHDPKKKPVGRPPKHAA
jgi:hypothetical protein